MTEPTAADLIDQPARRDIGSRLGETLFVEAGAGSGKTSCLVDRFLALVEEGTPAESIAAITFTERAAAELADRIRQELQKRAGGSERCAAALEQLDRAAIGTLHSFARRICSEHAIEAGLPPRIEVSDEMASDIAFTLRWSEFLDRLLEEPEAERPMRLFLALDGRIEKLRDLAEHFEDNWDLLRPGRKLPPIPALDTDTIAGELDAVAARAGECIDPSNKLLVQLEKAAEWATQLRHAIDEDASLGALKTVKFPGGSVGSKEGWPQGIQPVRDQMYAAGDHAQALVAAVTDACINWLAGRIAEFTLEGAAARRAEGALEFHDLLVLARAVLQDPQHGPTVRAEAAARYRRLLLDEFQDTDPIQAELAALIATGARPIDGRAWADLEVEPGHLFFVGDPKQSIYRFRRADIGMFMRARQTYSEEPIQLRANFRSSASIVDWVNNTFASVIVEEQDCQPAYVPLASTREDPPVGPPVSYVGSEPAPQGTRADPLREMEAIEVVTAVRRVLDEGWSVRDGTGTGWRTATAADICILIPARTSLPYLEAELVAAGVPYRVETSSLVYGSRVIRDLMAVARAVDDPTNQLALTVALRSSMFGCGDDDLYRWRHELGGRWNHQRPIPEAAADHPVGLAMTWMSELHRRRSWMTPSEVLAEIVAARRTFEVGFAERRPRDTWRRLRFVLDQARAWQDAGGSTLRDYLEWVTAQAADGARVVETVLPETDEDAVRIMTVHGAKGLEFPVTVLSGMTTNPAGHRQGVTVRFQRDGTWEIHLDQGISTSSFDLGRARDEQMDAAEHRRLLYVAATRARDHLIVSVTRPGRSSTSTARQTAAEILWGASPDMPDVGGERPAPPAADAAEPDQLPLTADDLASWTAGQKETRQRAARTVALSATRWAEVESALRDPGLEKDPRDLELPAWQKGRYGTAIGRAVHGTLQELDLSGDDRVLDVARSQAQAEGVLGKEEVIARLAQSALRAPIVQRAASLPHWKETYVGTAVGDVVVEGYVDLLFRDAEGLVIVDYKTDAWQGEEGLVAKVERYGPQTAVYALAVEQATGGKVVRAVLLFLKEDGSVEREVMGLADLVGVVRNRAGRGLMARPVD